MKETKIYTFNCNQIKTKEINNFVDKYCPNQKENINQYKNINELKNHLSIYIILEKINLKQYYYKDENNKPFLKNGLYISISHCDNMTIVYISDNHDCGIDIQCKMNIDYRSLSKRISSSFYSETNTLKKWMILESLYKLNRNKIIFKFEQYQFKNDYFFDLNEKFYYLFWKLEKYFICCVSYNKIEKNLIEWKKITL